MPSKVPLMTSWGDVSTNLAGASWLQITLLQSPAPLNGEHIVQLAPSTAAGLRADQIRDIHYTHFGQFTPQQAQNFTADMTAALSSVQLQSIQPNTFGNISLAGISGLPASLIPYVTVDQIVQLTRAQMFQMSCSQLNAFTDAQIQVFTPAQAANYRPVSHNSIVRLRGLTLGCSFCAVVPCVPRRLLPTRQLHILQQLHTELMPSSSPRQRLCRYVSSVDKSNHVPNV